MAGKKSLVGEWLAAAADDMSAAITKIQRWYNHGGSDAVVTKGDIKAIEAIELAYELLTDTNGPANRTGIYHKIKAAVGINSMKELTTLIQIADAIFLTNRPSEKRFKKAAIETFLMRVMQKAEEAGDYKSAVSASKEYIDLLDLKKDLSDVDTPVIETIIKLEANPQLLDNYNANDRASVKEAIKRLELMAKAKVTGQ